MKAKSLVAAIAAFTFTVIAWGSEDKTPVVQQPATPAVAALQHSKAAPAAKAQPYELQKMVVSATRGGPVDVLIVPQSVTSVDSADLNSTVKTTANEYIQTIPGIAAAPSGGNGDSSNRNSDYWNSGFTVRGLGAQRVLLIADGIRQSGQGVGYGGGNLSLYDTASLDRIEVLKGPASVLYGTDAFGGVVSLYSHEPRERDAFGFSGRSRTSFDASRNVFVESGLIDAGDKNWGVVVGGSYTQAAKPALPDNATTAYQGNYRKEAGNVNFVYRPTADSQWRILANVVSAYNIKIFDDSSFGSGKPGAFYYKIPYYQRAMVASEYEKRNTTPWLESWKVGLYSQELKRRFEHATPVMEKTPFPHFTGTNTTTTHDAVRTNEAQGRMVLDFAPHKVTVGTDLGLDSAYLPETAFVTPANTTTTTLKADAEQARAGFYAQDLWSLDEKNLVTLGGRFDTFSISDHLSSANDKTAEGVSGTLGYTYRVDPKTSLYASASSGFRSPDLEERFGSTVMQFFDQQVTVQGNPALNPERSYSFDIGAKRQAECGDWELSGYYNNIHDFIGLRQTSSSSLGGGRTAVVKTRTNMGDVDIYGVEAGWKSPASSPWRNYASLSRGWTDSGDAVALPSWTLGYGLGYRFTGFVKPLKAITPQWMGRYVMGSRDSVYNVYFPAFHEADAQLALEFACSSNLRKQLIVGVKNIFDTRYSEAFFSEPQPGRGAFAALQVDF